MFSFTFKVIYCLRSLYNTHLGLGSLFNKTFSYSKNFKGKICLLYLYFHEIHQCHHNRIVGPLGQGHHAFHTRFLHQTHIPELDCLSWVFSYCLWQTSCPCEIFKILSLDHFVLDIDSTKAIQIKIIAYFFLQLQPAPRRKIVRSWVSIILARIM